MKLMFATVLFALLPLAVQSAEPVKGANYFVTDVQSWKTGDKAQYWIWHGTGISHSSQGPFGTEPVECHGAGFTDAGGTRSEGICVNGIGDDTRTIQWQRAVGQDRGEWSILSGTGKYAGVTGGGTYKPMRMTGGRHMTEWNGEITMK